MSLTKQRAGELLDAFKIKSILVVGDAFIDSYTFGVINRLNPEDTSAPQLDVIRTENRTGGAGNVAHNVASLGAASILLGIRGKDENGLVLEKTAKEEGYKPFLIDDNRCTIVKHRQINETGKLLLRSDYESENERRPIGEIITNHLLEYLPTLVAQVDGILVSDYAKGIITREFSEKLLAIAKEHDRTVLADVKPAHIGYFTEVAMMAPNLKEAIASIGRESAPSVEEVADLLAKRYATQVFLTVGAEGICIAESAKGSTPFMVPQAHSRQVADSSGCGDTAAATILLARLCGATPQEAAELANAAAATTVTKVGAYAPTPDEVLRMLAS